MVVSCRVSTRGVGGIIGGVAFIISGACRCASSMLCFGKRTVMSMTNNNLSMTCQMMWPLVTTNYDSLLTQSVSSMTNNNLPMTCQMMWPLVTTNYVSLLTQSVSSMTNNNLSMNHVISLIITAGCSITAALLLLLLHRCCI